MAAALIAEEIRRLRSSRTTPDNGKTSHEPGQLKIGSRIIHFRDPDSTHTAIKNIFEQRIYDFEAIKPNPVIIDAGAHIGIATLRFKQLYPDAQITCFEPDSASLTMLHRNIDINSLENVEVIQAALSDKDGEAGFHTDGADGSRVDPGASGKCRTVRLSRFLNSPVDMLKLNVEGAEFDVLNELDVAGKLGLVERIVIEYHGWPDGQQSLGEILSILAKNSFRYLLHDFDDQTNPATKPPFRIRRRSPWFCLIYAERTGELHLQQSHTLKAIVSTPVPVSRVFGLDRGQPIDRYYIEQFLATHTTKIRGRVLEVADDTYTRRFCSDAIRSVDILHAAHGNKRSTIVADLSRPDSLPANSFDCIILTQTLHCIFDFRSAIANAHNALRPGGTLLATVPGISQISRYDMERWGDYWRFTTLSARRVFDSVFSPGIVTVRGYGNVLSAQAFLNGQCAEEFAASELDCVDRDYELLIAVAARKDG